MTDVRTRPTDGAIPVLVLNYNGWDDTFATLAAMTDHGHEVWLIDNGSRLDRTAEAAQRFSGLVTLRLPENLGWAGGYNRALDEVRRRGHRRAYLLNNDAIPLPDAVASAARTLGEGAGVAAVGSVILDELGEQVWFDGAYVVAESKSASELTDDVRPTRTINGAGFLLNLAAFDAVGPFYEDYFLYHEEADWCLRAQASGWRLLIDGSSRVRHGREKSDSNANATYYRVRNRFLALRRGISLDGGPESLISLVSSQLGHARRLRGEARAAAHAGLADGLRGRFGARRPGLGPARLQALVLACELVSAPWRVARKLGLFAPG